MRERRCVLHAKPHAPRHTGATKPERSTAGTLSAKHHFSLPILRVPRLLGAELACGAAQRAHLLRDRDRDRDRDHDRDRDRDRDRDLRS